MNSEERGSQPISCGMFGEKIETPDIGEFEIRSNTTVSTFSSNSESDFREDNGDGIDDCDPVSFFASTLQNMLLKLEGPDEGKNVLQQESSRILEANSSKQLGYKKKAPRQVPLPGRGGGTLS